MLFLGFLNRQVQGAEGKVLLEVSSPRLEKSKNVAPLHCDRF